MREIQIQRIWQVGSGRNDHEMKDVASLMDPHKSVCIDVVYENRGLDFETIFREFLKPALS